MDHVDLYIYTITVISLINFQSGICSGELGQMVARPLCMREVPRSIPGFSKTKIFINDYSLRIRTKRTVPGGLEPLTFWLTAERANRLRHGNFHEGKLYNFYQI